MSVNAKAQTATGGNVIDILCALPVLSALFDACAAPLPFATGYVEGEYVLVAPIETATIQSLAVQRGDHLHRGAALAEMERRAAEIALAAADAAVAQADAQLTDLRLGKRPEEIAVIRAALASARAESAEATRTAQRLTQLAESGSATAAQRDDAQTRAEIAAAHITEIEAELAVANLPARPQTIAAAEAGLKQAQAERDRAAWALSQRSLTAPADGVVTDILRRAGELAGPSSPVLSFLPDGATKLRLYVPAASVAEIAAGSLLDVHCDGCAAGLQAEVTYIARDPEFTPPVIYSIENRQKLVYLIEARPTPASDSLKPGLIVDVALPDAKE